MKQTAPYVHSIAILKACHQALPADAKVLAIEALIGSAFAALSDMHMLTVVGGRERTEDEYRGLFAAAGFRLTRVIPTGGPQSIVEAEPMRGRIAALASK